MGESIHNLSYLKKFINRKTASSICFKFDIPIYNNIFSSKKKTKQLSSSFAVGLPKIIINETTP